MASLSWPKIFKKTVDEIENQKKRAAMDQIAMDKMLAQEMPAIVAYKIDNGYLVQVRAPRDVARDFAPPRSGFFYCADHAAIADYIVSCTAREKLGVTQTTSPNFITSDKIAGGAITLTSSSLKLRST